MLQRLIVRYQAWVLEHTTIRQLDHRTDRELTDMGIDRANIAAIARRSAKADRP